MMSACHRKTLQSWCPFSVHYSFDGDSVNYGNSGPNPVGSLAGDASYTNAARVGAQALVLDGDGDYVDFGDQFDIGVNDWTVSLWMKTSIKKFARLVTKQKWAVATGSAGDMSIILDGAAWGGQWQFKTFVPVGTYYDNRFHHVAAVFDRDDTVTMYWDGVSIGSADITTNASINIYDSWPLMIGARYNYGAYDAEFDGVIDDVRISNKALTESEVRELAEYSFCARDSARYDFEDNTDNSGSDGPHPSGELYGDAAYTDSAKVGASALAFDGDGDYVKLGDVFDISTNDMTLAAWVKTTNKAFARIISKEGAGGYNISLHADDGVGCTLDSTYHYYAATYEDGKFHHLAATYDRDGDATVYWDGQELGSFDISHYNEEDLNNHTSLCVGWRATGGSGAFNGIIDDVQLFNRVLTQQEILDLFPVPKGTLFLVN